MKIQSLKKLQTGGNITRRQARKASYDNFGYKPGAGYFDTAYTNAKNALRENGSRGKELRQTARSWFMNKPVQNINVASIEDIPLEFTYDQPISVQGPEDVNVPEFNINDFNNIFSRVSSNKNSSRVKTNSLKTPTISDNILIEEPIIDNLPENYITDEMLAIPNIKVDIPENSTSTDDNKIIDLHINPSDYNFITPLPGKNYSKKNKRFWDTTAGYYTSQLIPGYGQYRAAKVAVNDIKTNPDTREVIKSTLIPGYVAVAWIKNLFRK